MVVVDEVAVVQVGDPAGRLEGLPAAGVQQVIAAEFHLPPVQGPCPVDPARKGGADSAASALLAPAHGPHAAPCAGHRIAGTVRRPGIVGIVSVQDERNLVFLGKPAGEGGSEEPGIAVSPLDEGCLLLRRDVMSDSTGNVGEQSPAHSWIERDVDHGFALTVVDSGELALVGLLLDRPDLMDHLGRYVFGGDLRVVQEKGFSFDGDFLHGLPVDGERYRFRRPRLRAVSSAGPPAHRCPSS